MDPAPKNVSPINAKKRTDARLGARLPVLFGIDEPGEVGRLKNISRRGAKISTKSFIQPGAVLNLRLETTVGPLDLVGVVRWSRRFSLQFSFVDDCELGVEFTQLDPRFPEFVASLATQFRESRGEPRFEKVYPVTWRDGETGVTRNISRNGLFVLNPYPPAKGSHVTLRVVIADLEETVEVVAEVLRAIDIDAATAAKTEPGFAVRFLRFATQNQGAFEGYIDDLTGRAHE